MQAQVEVITNPSDLIKPETEITGDIFWHIKAYHYEAKLLDIKAIDKNGVKHPVKAIQVSENTSVLNVKAIVNGKRLPIKLIVKGDAQYYPAKAIMDDGTLIDIKAITEDGQILDVKGTSKSGNIIHLRAIDKDFKRYNIIAISPLGNVMGVKGVKMIDAEVESVVNGVKIFAHVKSIPQW
tara:strand:+ start:177 stop:719 length:543 start_codon:yes stop_codon:yes gene_type:complete